MKFDAGTTLDLADNQFIKIRRGANGYAVYFKVVQTGRDRWTFTREHKAAVLGQLLSDPQWSAQIIEYRLRNLLIDCWRSRLDK